MIFPLPNICESLGHVAWGVVTQVNVGEGPRFTKQGVGVKSEPQVRQETVVHGRRQG